MGPYMSRLIGADIPKISIDKTSCESVFSGKNNKALKLRVAVKTLLHISADKIATCGVVITCSLHATRRNNK